MLYRPFGNTGLKVSAFSLGSWITFEKLDIEAVKVLIQLAFDSGVNLFDTAEVYSAGRAEDKLGTALKSLALLREKYMICSKVFWGGSSHTEMGLTRKHIIEGCHQSLKRLKTDYLDFYLCHRPDNNTPIEETIIAMNLLIQQGKILYWGTSEWPNELIMEAYCKAKLMHLIPPSIEQFEYNMLCHHKGDVDFPVIKRKIGIGAMATMPLASGILAGRYNYGTPDDSRAKLQTHPCFQQMIEIPQGKEKIEIAIQLEQLAQDLNITLPQLALFWCLQNAAIATVILGAHRVDHLQQNLETIHLASTAISSSMAAINHLIGRKLIVNDEPTYEEVLAES